MIDRYAREEMKKIWDLNSKFHYYLQVEIAVAEAYADLGEFPVEDISELKKKASFDINRIEQIEEEVKHDVKAHALRQILDNNSKGVSGMHVSILCGDILNVLLPYRWEQSYV